MQLLALEAPHLLETTSIFLEQMSEQLWHALLGLALKLCVLICSNLDAHGQLEPPHAQELILMDHMLAPTLTTGIPSKLVSHMAWAPPLLPLTLEMPLSALGIPLPQELLQILNALVGLQPQWLLVLPPQSAPQG